MVEYIIYLQEEPLSAISAIWPKAMQGHQHVRQPAILIQLITKYLSFNKSCNNPAWLREVRNENIHTTATIFTAVAESSGPCGGMSLLLKMHLRVIISIIGRIVSWNTNSYCRLRIPMYWVGSFMIIMRSICMLRLFIHGGIHAFFLFWIKLQAKQSQLLTTPLLLLLLLLFWIELQAKESQHSTPLLLLLTRQAS